MDTMSRIESLRRIREEFMELNRNPNPNLCIVVGLPNEDDLFNWRITVIGPRNTPYSGGLFSILIHFPDNYPNSHPKVCFKTPIYHLNVNPREIPNSNPLGDICCLTILNRWKPEYKIADVLVSIYALFYMVNPENPIGFERRDEYINNRILYEEKVKYFTRKYAYPNNNINREYNEVWDFSYDH